MIPSTKSFTLHLGSPQGNSRLDEHDRVSAIHKVTRRFDAFTLTEGKRCSGGSFEDVLLIHLTTDDSRAIAELAEDLRRTFQLNGIGIQFGEHYLRSTEKFTTEQVASAITGLLKVPS